MKNGISGVINVFYVDLLMWKVCYDYSVYVLIDRDEIDKCFCVKVVFLGKNKVSFSAE